MTIADPMRGELAAMLRAARRVDVRRKSLGARSVALATLVLAAVALGLSLDQSVGFPHGGAPRPFLFTHDPAFGLAPQEEFRMRTLQSLGVVSSIAIASAASAQNAVQWRVQDGGNGHWYGLVTPASRLSATSAAAQAGIAGGSLASINSAAENQFVFELASKDPARWELAWPGAFQITGPWIGASYSASTWTWMDGTTWMFTNWAPTEPNYLDEETAVLFMGPAGGLPTPQWNNIQPTYLNWGYVIEWSADCNGDGVVDFGQTASGELPDFDGDHVPDCCEQATICSPAPQQWSLTNGGNGHWYQMVVPPARISATNASLAARLRGGELASISDSGENNFVFSLASVHPSLWVLVWPGATQISGPWLGAAYTGTIWTWLDASPWTFANWAPSEPNYLFEETAVHFMGSAAGRPTNKWNNNRPDYLNWGYMVEWSADCNGDGVVDFGQIRSGELSDADFNGIPDCCENGASCDPCRADVDQSGAVNGVDLAAVLNNWGTSGGKQPRSDINHDGIVNGADLAEVLNAWGPCH